VDGSLLLFDIDGTLLRSEGLGRRALDRALLERYGWADATAGVSFLGATDPGILADVFARFGRGPDEARRERAALFAHYVRLLAEEARVAGDRCRALPGVAALLEHLVARGDCLVGLLTGNVAEGARIKLEVTGLGGYFRLGAYGEDAETREALLPVARARAAALGWAQPDPRRIVVIGDTPRDVAVARAHGARAVAVATGWTAPEELEACGPDALLPDLSRLEESLDALLG
jgi:phosphoglycolate phosphatase-like HAD superfamily hydrolase